MPCLQHTDVLRGVLGESSSSPLLPEAPVHSPSVTAHHPFSRLLFNLTSPKGKVRILNRIDPEKGFQVKRYWSNPENILGPVVRRPLLEPPHTDLSLEICKTGRIVTLLGCKCMRRGLAGSFPFPCPSIPKARDVFIPLQTIHGSCAS